MDIYQRIGVVCRQTPAGKTATYGQIALLCGKSGNARQVGYALKHDLAGEEIPAHRVVNSSGRLSGAAYFETWDLQKLLLEQEGVEVVRQKDGWYVDRKKYGWSHTLADAQAFRELFQHMGI